MLGVKNEVQIDTGYNGQDAVALMEQAIEMNEVDRYILILTDCSMPVMDGYEATKKMRELIKQYQDNDLENNFDIEPL